MTGTYQVCTTLGDDAAAADLAAALVDRRLVACAQVLGPVRSIYRWNGSVERTTEWLCIFKTVESRLASLLETIRTLHPYEQPEIVATAIVAGDPGYLEWIRQETTP